MVDLRSRAALAVAALAVALFTLPGPAVAAPVTVDFRIEGKDTTHFDGPVTSDVRMPRRSTSYADSPSDSKAMITFACRNARPTWSGRLSIRYGSAVSRSR